MSYLEDLKRNSYTAGYDAGLKLGLWITLIAVLLVIAGQYIYGN